MNIKLLRRFRKDFKIIKTHNGKFALIEQNKLMFPAGKYVTTLIFDDFENAISRSHDLIKKKINSTEIILKYGKQLIP